MSIQCFQDLLSLRRESENVLFVSIVSWFACCLILLTVIGSSIQCPPAVTRFKFAFILNEHLSFNFNPPLGTLSSQHRVRFF